MNDARRTEIRVQADQLFNALTRRIEFAGANVEAVAEVWSVQTWAPWIDALPDDEAEYAEECYWARMKEDLIVMETVR